MKSSNSTPKYFSLVGNIYSELMGNMSKKSLETIPFDSTRDRVIGAITTILAQSVRKGAMYYIYGMYSVFDGKTYSKFTKDDMRQALRLFFESGKYRFDESFCRNSTINEISESLFSVIRTKTLDADRSLVSMENGILNIEDLTFMAHDKSLTPYCYVPVSYDPSADCVGWKTFLRDVMPSPKKRELLQEFAGLPLIDRKKYSIEKMIILLGSGSNGKSVIAKVLTGVFGAHNVTHFGLDDLLRGADKMKNIASINGKLLNYSDEIRASTSERFGDSFKALVSGDPSPARSMYGEPFIADRIPVLYSNTNKLPRFDDTSNGLKRRVAVLEFEKIFKESEQDKELHTKLLAEAPGIFNWILEGRNRFIKNGGTFSHMELIDDGARSFMATTSNVVEWILENDMNPTYEDEEDSNPRSVLVKELYADYDQWCIAHKYNAKTQREFTNTFLTLGFKKGRLGKGIVIKLYGKKQTKIKRAQAFASKEYMTTAGRKIHPCFIDNHMIVRGLFSLSLIVHLSKSWLQSMLDIGRLDSAIMREHSHGGVLAFDVDKVYDIAKRYHAWLTEDRQKEFDENVQTNAYEMREFNKEMNRLGLPFRKLGLGMIKGYLYNPTGGDIIMVDPKWVYNEEEAEELIIKHEQKKAKSMK